MPFMLVHRPSSNTYAVRTMSNGRTHGWTTKEKAMAQKRILEIAYKNEK